LALNKKVLLKILPISFVEIIHLFPNNIHITLILRAYAFLVSLCLHASRPPDDPEAGSSPTLIAFTPSEVRHLLAHLFFPAPTSVPLICQWSRFRRSHQYWAGYSHRRRRQKAG
jgi:hypothetical protein